jgi:hypothetical protein
MIGLVAGGGVVVFAGGYVFSTTYSLSAILRLWFLRFDRAAAKQPAFSGRSLTNLTNERGAVLTKSYSMAFLLRRSWRGCTPPHDNPMTHRKTYTRAQRLITISCTSTTRGGFSGDRNGFKIAANSIRRRPCRFRLDI